MSRRTYISFAVFAVFCAVLIPAWAISHEGGEEASPEDVPANLEEGKELFITNCGACHTLDKAGSDGVIGPNLDDLLGNASPEANKMRVLGAIENGINGRMPKGILAGEDAETVSEFVAQTAGQ